MVKKALCLFLLFIACTGCSQRVLLLKQLASSQKEMENYIARQKKGFLRLKQDIQRNRLQKGMSRQAVTKRYGEPVFCDPAEGGTPTHPAAMAAYPPIRYGGVGIASGAPLDPEIAQSCLYRAPTEYFSADKAYLYFNRQEFLHSWKYEPAEN
jgi:hypothetical protein